MKYQQGNIGRVFLARTEHGENPLDEIKALACKERIRVAVFFVLGALQSGSAVTGPREVALPPVPHWFQFEDGREVVGMGTILFDGDEPILHLHAALGREEKAVVCCLREAAEVFITLEVVILELCGINALRELDPLSGQRVIRLSS